MASICPTCGHVEERMHIGKSLVMLRGYLTSKYGPIRTWQDWKNVLEGNPLTVRDEYGNAVDAQDFIRMMEETDLMNRRRQFDWVRAHRPTIVQDGYDWLDPDGFSFTYQKFC